MGKDDRTGGRHKGYQICKSSAAFQKNACSEDFPCGARDSDTVVREGTVRCDRGHHHKATTVHSIK